MAPGLDTYKTSWRPAPLPALSLAQKVLVKDVLLLTCSMAIMFWPRFTAVAEPFYALTPILVAVFCVGTPLIYTPGVEQVLFINMMVGLAASIALTYALFGLFGDSEYASARGFLTGAGLCILVCATAAYHVSS